GGLDHVSPREQDMNQPKASPDDARVSKQSAHFLRPRARRHIKILGPMTDQEVANAASYQVGFVAGPSEASDNFLSSVIDEFRIEFNSNLLRLWAGAWTFSRLLF